MDHQRLFLYGALGLLIILIWQTWQIDYGPAGERGDRPAAESPSDATETAEPAPDTPDAPVTSGQRDDDTADAAETAEDTPVDTGDAVLQRADRVRVVTDLLEVEIDTYGADLRRALLLRYRKERHGDDHVELLGDSGGKLFVAQSGLQAGDSPAPTHHERFAAERDDYRLAEGQESISVPLTWEEEGVRVTKTYTFHRGSYAVDVAFEVENTGDEPWTGRQYRQLQRNPIPEEDQPTLLLPAFFGAAYYSEADRYEEVAFGDIADEPLQKQLEGGWAAMVEHYFLTAWIPGAEETNTLYSKAVNDDAQPRYIIGLYSPGRQIAPGEAGTFATRLFIGPKENEHVEAAAEGLPLTIDYGYMTFLSAPLFWLLDHIHSFVGNWGWAIVLLTLLIKIVFYKLSETSYRSMARMKKLQPKIQQLKDRYGDDREKMGRAMMDLYKKEKINPLGGCLPILVQIPVFIALYWMLLGSVELRHADFALWIDDLSARDPYFLLPLLMGASMWAQQKLNPAPVDPMQQRIFQALPIVFTVFFAFFPAGLVLYWLTNNVLSIGQQYYITRHVVGDAHRTQESSGSGKE